jgi:hypothetical protein
LSGTMAALSDATIAVITAMIVVTTGVTTGVTGATTGSIAADRRLQSSNARR